MGAGKLQETPNYYPTQEPLASFSSSNIIGI